MNLKDILFYISILLISFSPLFIHKYSDPDSYFYLAGMQDGSVFAAINLFGIGAGLIYLCICYFLLGIMMKILTGSRIVGIMFMLSSIVINQSPYFMFDKNMTYVMLFMAIITFSRWYVVLIGFFWQGWPILLAYSVYDWCYDHVRGWPIIFIVTSSIVFLTGLWVFKYTYNFNLIAENSAYSLFFIPDMMILIFIAIVYLFIGKEQRIKMMLIVTFFASLVFTRLLIFFVIYAFIAFVKVDYKSIWDIFDKTISDIMSLWTKWTVWGIMGICIILMLSLSISAPRDDVDRMLPYIQRLEPDKTVYAHWEYGHVLRYYGFDVRYSAHPNNVNEMLSILYFKNLSCFEPCQLMELPGDRIKYDFMYRNLYK